MLNSQISPHLLAVYELGSRSLVLNSSLLHQVSAVGHRQGELLVLLGEQDSDALVAQSAHQGRSVPGAFSP